MQSRHLRAMFLHDLGVLGHHVGDTRLFGGRPPSAVRHQRDGRVHLEGLVTDSSTRARHIDAEKNRLIADYVAQHGHQPSNAMILKLRAQATLATLHEKQVRSLADLTAEWRIRATKAFGRDATTWARQVTANDKPLLLRADDVPLDVIGELGRSVVEMVGEKRSIWRRWNLMAEVARLTMGWRFATMQDREAIVAMVADAAEFVSLRLTLPELAT